MKKSIKKFLSIIMILVMFSGVISSAEVNQGVTLLLMHMDGEENSKTFIEQTGKVVTPNTGVTISAAQKKFGTGSAYFDGTSNGNFKVAGDFNLGTSDFTIEFYLFAPEQIANAGVLTSSTTSPNWAAYPNAYGISFNTPTTLAINFQSPVGTANGMQIATIEPNKLQHIAVCREGTQIRSYVNGKQVATGTIAANQAFNCENNTIAFGQHDSRLSFPFKGYLDEVRIIKSKAVYSSDFTLPTGAFASAPIDLIAVGGNATAVLNWNSVNDGSTYTVKRATNPNGPYVEVATNLTTKTFTDTNLVNDTTYYYVVKTVSLGVESSDSNQVSVTPKASIGSLNSAILEITMTNGQIKEYDLTPTELTAFLTWYDNRSAGSGKAYYIFNIKHKIKPFLARTEHIAFDKISSFEIKEYLDK